MAKKDDWSYRNFRVEQEIEEELGKPSKKEMVDARRLSKRLASAKFDFSKGEIYLPLDFVKKVVHTQNNFINSRFLEIKDIETAKIRLQKNDPSLLPSPLPFFKGATTIILWDGKIEETLLSFDERDIDKKFANIRAKSYQWFCLARYDDWYFIRNGELGECLGFIRDYQTQIEYGYVEDREWNESDLIKTWIRKRAHDNNLFYITKIEGRYEVGYKNWVITDEKNGIITTPEGEKYQFFVDQEEGKDVVRYKKR